MRAGPRYAPCRSTLCDGSRGLDGRAHRARAMTTAQPQDPGAPDRHFGRYVVREELARGGMGVVYRAYDPKLDRTVALKVLRDFEPDAEALARFMREARTIARLAHPTIITVFDIGELDGSVFFVMELVEGTSLRRLLNQRGRLEPGHAAAIVRQVAHALAYAHARGCVHRDIKPDNILLSGDAYDQVKLADFGIAKVTETLGGGLTSTGAQIGTPSYMAPEQWRGEAVDARADLFALGVVAYEALSGSNPFRGGSSEATMRNVLEVHPPPLAAVAAGVPGDVDQVVMRCLAKGRDERHADGAAFLAAWEQCGREGPASAPVDVPGVRLLGRGRRRDVPPILLVKESSTIGSAATDDVVLEGQGVCPSHVRIVRHGRVLAVAASEVGAKLNGRTIDGETRITSGDWLTLGDTTVQIDIRGAGGSAPAVGGASPVEAERAAPVSVASSGGRVVTIGRLPECDVHIDSPAISRRHARVVEDVGGWFVEDLESTNGTFVNGERVTERRRLFGGERVQLGGLTFVFRDGALRETSSSRGIRIEARGLRKTVVDGATAQRKDLLGGIDLVIEPGEFVGIFGTSGSGKSTLMDALNGRRPATAGQVLYNDTDLYRAFDLFKSTIGYVPQQDIVHRRITVRSALAYTARLRLPPDTSESEIDEQITRTLARVGLDDKALQPIDTPAPLSGGQLKRVSVAVELVSNPNVLFLDEATSGLDAGTDKRMMRLFANLAADGKIVACVTHTLENVDACDLVVVLARGRLVYFGPPAGVVPHFGIRRLADVYEVLEGSAPEVWADRYAASDFHREYVARRLAPRALEAPRPADEPIVVRSTRRGRRLDLRQTAILTRRYLELMFCDRRNVAVLLAQAPIVGVVIGLVFGGDSVRPRAATESQIAFMLVVSAVWFGCLNAAREIVKELPIYLRERAISVRLWPYVLSKVLPLAALCAIQCVTLFAVVAAFVDMPGDVGRRVAALVLTGFAATTMGLTVSALVDSADKAIAAVPILLIPQVILSGALVELGKSSKLVAQATTISYWGYRAVKTTLAPDVKRALEVSQDFGVDMACLGAFFVGFLLTALAALQRKDRISS